MGGSRLATKRSHLYKDRSSPQKKLNYATLNAQFAHPDGDAPQFPETFPPMKSF
ncbi:hypothetical protein RE6C_02543 [Rhodopirellula europaea 6C]|uniref:Uncharacterized protein n=1 Tax=Rhodopirellula europaea 6C TaxID=1263867 RepID=M2B4R1_9BACT|nr:hypothetical protein RE6C_02543 [Rhodopirellula europaea 6C]